LLSNREICKNGQDIILNKETGLFFFPDQKDKFPQISGGVSGGHLPLATLNIHISSPLRLNPDHILKWTKVLPAYICVIYFARGLGFQEEAFLVSPYKVTADPLTAALLYRLHFEQKTTLIHFPPHYQCPGFLVFVSRLNITSLQMRKMN